MPAATLKPLRPRDRLTSLATIVTWVFRLAVVATGLRLVLGLLGRGPLFGAHIGGPSPSLPGVCLSAAQALLPHAGGPLGLAGLSPGVSAALGTANLCAAHPSAGQSLAFTVTLLPIDLLRLGALYLAQRLARAVAHAGVYDTQAARLLLILGWWLLAGGLAATVAEAFARLNLLGQLITGNVDWGQWPVAWSVDWTVAWTGLGLVVLARIMRIGAGMRADLEGTV